MPKQVGKTVTFKEEPIYQGYIYCRVKMSQEVRSAISVSVLGVEINYR